MAELTERELRDTVRSLDSRISRLNSAINVPQGPRYIMGLYQNDTDNVSKDKQAYYDIGKDEKEFLKSTPSITARKAKIAESTRQRALIKASNPLLESALVAGGNEVASELNMLTNLEEMIKDSSIEMPIGTRQRLAMVSSRVRQFVSLANDASIREADNFADIKRDFKLEVENLIASLSAGDAILTEASRAIFKSILGYYSRDTYTARTYKGY